MSIWFYHPYNSGVPSSSDGKESASNAGDLGSIPGLGRSPGEGNDNPLQYPCLENPMDRGAWWATVHGAAESDTTEFSLQLSGQPDGWTSKRHRVSPASRGPAVWTARPMDQQASPCELCFPRNRSAAPSLGPHPSPAASRTPCCLPWKNAAAFWPGPPSGAQSIPEASTRHVSNRHTPGPAQNWAQV